MTSRTGLVRGSFAIGFAVAAACTSTGDDAAEPSTAPIARVEVSDAEPPDTAVVTNTVATSSTTPPDGAEPSVSESATPTVEVFGLLRDPASVEALEAIFEVFGDVNGIDVTYVGDTNYSATLTTRIAAGDPPDIILSAQSTEPVELGGDGVVVALEPDVADAVRANWPADINDAYTSEGVQYAVPVGVDLKSLVWYSPDRFDEIGFVVPSTFAEFETMLAQSVESGVAPLCVGIESGAATGWVYSDWVEDIVLRRHGVAVYDQWIDNDIDFSDDRIVASMQEVLDLWAPDNVFAEGGTIESTSFLDGVDPLVDGECLMHRQAGFYRNYIPLDVGLSDGSSGGLDVFLLPSDTGSPALISGLAAAALDDRPEVWAVVEFMSSVEFADARAESIESDPANSFASVAPYSLASGHDPLVHGDFGQRVLELLLSADSYRFDASDQMPSVVNSSFWAEGTRAAVGDITASEAAAAIDSTWPN